MSEFKHTPGQVSWEYHPDVGAPAALTTGPADVLIATGDMGRAWLMITDADAATLAARWNACDRAGLSDRAIDADVIRDMVAIVDKILWCFPDLDEIIGGQSVEEAAQLVQMAKDARASLNR